MKEECLISTGFLYSPTLNLTSVDFVSVFRPDVASLLEGQCQVVNMRVRQAAAQPP